MSMSRALLSLVFILLCLLEPERKFMIKLCLPPTSPHCPSIAIYLLLINPPITHKFSQRILCRPACSILQIYKQ